MSPEIRDAIESAREPMEDELRTRRAETRRRYSFVHVWMTALAVLKNVPPGMTVDELIEELELANNQGPMP